MKLPPTNDPSLPSYQCPDYLRFVPWREILGDCFEGDLQRSKAIHEYLPKERGEPDEAYADRISRTPFENHVAATIKSFAGAICSLAWSDDVPDWLEAIEEDFDLTSNNVEVVVDRSDVSSLLDGYCFWLLDYHRPQVSNRAQEMTMPGRPFVRIIPACSVPNFRQKNGVVQSISIVEQLPRAEKYGESLTTCYRVIEGDTWRLVELIETNKKKLDGSSVWIEQPVLDENGNTLEGQYTSSSGKPLGYCPVIAYCLGGEQWRSAAPPEFLNLAQHNIALFQAGSDYRAIVRSLAPTPWIRADVEAPLSGQGEKFLSLGPHDWLNLGSSPHAACGLLQGNPEAVAPARQLVQDIRHQIYSEGLSLKSGADGGGKVAAGAATATEIRARFNEIQKRLKRFAEGKQSALNTMLKVLADYMGDKSELPKAQVTADISTLMSSEESVINLYNAGLLSKEAAVARIEQLGYTNDAHEELERLGAPEDDLATIAESVAMGDVAEAEDGLPED
jgi:hypothetical protein